MKQLILGLIFVTLNGWAQRPPPPPPPDFSRAQKISITDYITSFQSYRDKNNKYVRVEGLIPEVCSDKIKLNYKCDEPTNTVTFIFKDATGDALSCLKKNQNLCTDNKHKDCVSLDKIARKSKDNSVVNKVVFKKSESEDCAKIQVSTAKVSFQTKLNEVVRREEKTEAGVCVECLKTKEPQLAKLKVQAEEMNDAVELADRPRPAMKMKAERERPERDEFEDESPRERPQQAMKGNSSSFSGRPSMAGGMGGAGQSSSASMTNMLTSVLTSLMSLSYSQSMNSYGASYGYSPNSGYMNYGVNQSYGYLNSGYNQNYNYMNYSSLYPYSSNQNYYSKSSYYPYSNYYANYNYGTASSIPQYPYTGTSYNSYYNSALPSLGTATSTVINGR